MIYGQEVYFSVSKTLLKKRQSVDSKSIKLATGVPEHTNKSYTEAGMISLSDRKLAVSEYAVRSLAVNNSVTEEMFIDSNNDYRKELKPDHLVSQSEII